jgi:hypothetical protein
MTDVQFRRKQLTAEEIETKCDEMWALYEKAQTSMNKSREMVMAAMEDWPKAMWKGIELDLNDDMGLDDSVFCDRMRFIGAMTNKVTINTDKMEKNILAKVNRRLDFVKTHHCCFCLEPLMPGSENDDEVSQEQLLIQQTLNDYRNKVSDNVDTLLSAVKVDEEEKGVEEVKDIK